MGRRSLADWQTIIEAQQASGLTIVEYCRHHQLNVKSFGARKAKIKQNTQQPPPAAPAGFIQVKPAITSPMPAVILKTGNVTLQLPPSSTPEWLGQLVREVCL